jgi:hypothetical protein
VKKINLILFIVLSFNSLIYSQKVPEFKLKKDGIKPLVIEFDTSYNASFIYSRVKEWIALNNRYPKSVTRIDKVDSLIKFSCYTKDGWKSKINNVDYWNELQYTLMVEIKDFKCRITFASDADRYKFWYNNDGTLKQDFKESKATFEDTVNKTLKSLYNYIVSTENTKTDDW